jgi:hypothetical protein
MPVITLLTDDLLSVHAPATSRGLVKPRDTTRTKLESASAHLSITW